MSATTAGCGASVGINFGKEYYNMIVNAGYRGKVGAAAPKFTYTGQYNIRKDGVVELLTSGTIVFLEPKVIDLFMVGGGGAGSYITGTQTNKGAPGGGGGYTRTALRQSVTGSYYVTVGAGGVYSTETPSANHGQETSFGSVLSAPGGKSRGAVLSSNFSGGDGGSGGGGGVSSNSDYGMGGSDGNKGETGYPINSSYAGGVGQGFTTREFGEKTGKLYAGGGGGGRYISGSTIIVSPGGTGGGGSGAWAGTSNSQAAAAGVANTGGGGGGGALSSIANTQRGASGGSGIVCFRAAQELPELAGTWVLNERLYAPEKDFDEKISFTFYTENGSSFSGERIVVYNNQLSIQRSAVIAYQIYNFSSNTWQQKYKTWKFEVGTTASDEFRAWLASNATKQ